MGITPEQKAEAKQRHFNRYVERVVKEADEAEFSLHELASALLSISLQRGVKKLGDAFGPMIEAMREKERDNGPLGGDEANHGEDRGQR